MPVASEIDSSLDKFWRSARILRTWLVAFGVGLPAVILANEKLFVRLAESGYAYLVFGLIFAAGGIQVVMECRTKYYNWQGYMKEIDDIVDQHEKLCSEGPPHEDLADYLERSNLVIKALKRAVNYTDAYYLGGIFMDIASILLLGAAGLIAIFICIASVNATPTTMPALP